MRNMEEGRLLGGLDFRVNLLRNGEFQCTKRRDSWIDSVTLEEYNIQSVGILLPLHADAEHNF